MVESRDLLQDLRNAQEGIKISHASDLKKQAAQAKRDRKKKRKESKDQKSKKRIIEYFKRIVSGKKDATADMKRVAVEQLKKEA